MAVLKNKTRDNFTMISNNILRDKNLSMKDRGVLCTIFSLPDGWEFSVAGLSSLVSDGVDAISASIRNLEALGYLVRTKKRDACGRFTTEIEVFVQKRDNSNPPSRETHDGNTITAEPSWKNRDGSTVTENPIQYNTDNTKKTSKKDDIKSINPSEDPDQKDKETDIERIRALIAENIHLDWLLEIADRRDPHEVNMVHEVYDVICDMVCYPRNERIQIKDTCYPWEAVRDRFLKLRYEHVADVLNRIVDASLGIKNMSKYLISTLYTASLVGTIEAQANLHDDYLKYLRGKPYE